MKILLFGKYGQLGWELNRSLQGLGQIVAFDFPEIDFTNPSSLRPLLENVRPQIVINAVAYTDVDRAESEADRARLINADAPGVLAGTCREIDAAFLHFSTDYVFDGKKGAPYTEDDPPFPLNIYGKTKLEGEKAVIQAGGVSLIFRTAWVYSLRRDSFVNKVLGWARTQSELRIVEDQVSNPTWARALAEITSQLVAKASSNPLPWLSERKGLYHIAGRGHASRYEIAMAIIRNSPEALGLLTKTILPARTQDFLAAAVRPEFSALDCGRFERIFAMRLPDWELALKLALEG